MIARLEMLIALAKARHFGNAAEALGVTQPTLSSGIKRLEEELGVQLVQRGSRYRGLTPEGQKTLDWARRIVGDTRQLREEMRVSRHGLTGALRIAVIPTALTWASHLAASFQAAHPEVRFSILSRPSKTIVGMLEDIEIDGGITYLDDEPLGRVTSVPLYRERYVLICGPDHPLAGRVRLDWGALDGLRLCLLTPDMQNRRIVDRALTKAGAAPRAQVESNSTVVLASHVARGGWASILPRDMADFLCAGRELVRVPLEGGPSPAVGLIAPTRDPHTPLMAAMLGQANQLAKPID